MLALSRTRIERIAALRADVRAIEAGQGAQRRERLAFGLAAVDDRLEGGGLAAAAFHEVTGASSSLADDAAASLFIAGIAGRRAKQGGTVLWALARRDLFAPGLALAGLPPERLIYAECGGDDEVLAVVEEGLRHGGLAAVVGEIGRVSMAAGRRLQLAAEQGSTMALLLRRWQRSGTDPLLLPSAAVTRWRIACLPSAELPVPGVGRPRWHVMLARQRGGEPAEWNLESPDAKGRLALPAPSPHRSPAADRGQAEREAA
jgi:protein ImuA